ncbi:MAG: GTP-binding protein [Lachnospiraceae bacterium]|nr:GTP-binding protein [Lachnospiraceae bacterium]
MTKIDIFSGFLGAGKTTLIKKLIDEAYKGEKLVLIENEFGEVGIDGGFLKDAGIEITEMNSGCICCTLVGDFSKNLHEVMERFSPQRILIEPSGVGKLSDVMASVIDMEKEADVKLNALVTVVNAKKASKQMKAFGEFFNNQIEHATTVVLSRSQEATPEQLEFCTKLIQEKNPKAAVITTDWNELTGEKILSAMEGHDNLEMKTIAMMHHEEDQKAHDAEHHHHDHDHDEHEHHHHDHDHDHDHEEHEHHHHDHDHEEHEHHHHDHDHDEHEHHHHDHDHEEHGHHHHDHEGHHHHHHHADDIFDTWGRETPHIFEKSDIEKALAAFADSDDYGFILRSKGMVPASDGTWIYFDFVEGDYELRTGEPDYTGRLVVIGTDLKEHDIEHLFGLE